MTTDFQGPVVYGSLSPGGQPLSDFDVSFDSTYRMGTLGCTVTGLNTLTIASLPNYPTMTGYGGLSKIGFIANSTSTSLVSIGYNPLSSLNAYQNDGVTSLGSGDIVVGAYYEFAFNPTLNSNAGGWQSISNAPVLSGPIANLSVLSNITGGTAVASANNAATVGASEILLQTQSPSGVGSVSFTNIPSGYDQYILRISGLLPASNGDSLSMRFSENNGVSYISVLYIWSGAFFGADGSTSNSGTTDPSSIYLTGPFGISNAAGSYNGVVTFMNLGYSAIAKSCLIDAWFNAAGQFQRYVGMGSYNGDENIINAIQLFFNGSNIASGKISLYAVRNV